MPTSPATVATGSVSRNVVPCPGALSAKIEPPCFSTIRLVTGSPSPIPLALRVKNGSNTRLAVSVSMPGPVSVMRISSSAFPAGGLDRQRTLAVHRFIRVGQEVQQHLSELLAIGEHRRNLVEAQANHAHTLGRGSDRQRLLDQVGEIHGLRDRLALAGEVEQGIDDRGRGGDLALGSVEVPRRRRLVGVRGGRPDQIERVRQHAERIAQLVPDGGGDLTDRRQALLQHEPRLRLLERAERALELRGALLHQRERVVAPPHEADHHRGGQKRAQQPGGQQDPRDPLRERPHERLLRGRRQQPGGALDPHLLARHVVTPEREVGRGRDHDLVARRSRRRVQHRVQFVERARLRHSQRRCGSTALSR